MKLILGLILLLGIIAGLLYHNNDSIDNNYRGGVQDVKVAKVPTANDPEVVAIPEPATLTLLALGSALTLAKKRQV